MANEIAQNFTTGLVLYACRFQLNGDVFVTDGSSDEVWSDPTDYEVYLTEAGTSGHYVGDFDTSGNIDAGVYRVVVKVRVGAAPADTDPSISQGLTYWNGTSAISPYSISTDVDAIKVVVDAILVDTGTTIPLSITALSSDVSDVYDLVGDVETLVTNVDTVVDAILVDTGTTIPATLETITANTGKVVNVYPTGDKRVITGGSTLGYVPDEKL